MQTAALYIRVSTDKQDELSPDAQRRLLNEYAERNAMMISSEYVFVENGISGKKADKRPQFQQMIGYAKSKEHPFDVILVWKYSRFARNQEESIVYKSLLKRNNVDVISISEPIIDGPFGTLIERIIEWMDEYYSIRLSGEVTRGMTEKALRGGYQAKPPLGYKVLYPKEPPVIVPEEANIIRMIFDKYVNDDMTFFQIARHLNSLGIKTERGRNFERRAIEYIIQNPTYKGFIRWNRTTNATNAIKDRSEWIIKKGNHEPIIPEEIFDAAQERYHREYTPRNSRPLNEYKHWLSGLVKCSSCGCSLTASKVRKSRYMHFMCNGYTKGKCSVRNGASERLLIDYVIKLFEKVLDTGYVEYTVMKSEYNIDSALLEQQLAKFDAKEQRIKDSYINGIDTLEEYKHNKEVLHKEKIKLEAKIKELKAVHSEDHGDEMLNRIKDVYNIITDPNAENSVKNKALRSIVEKWFSIKRKVCLISFFIINNIHTLLLTG